MRIRVLLSTSFSMETQFVYVNSFKNYYKISHYFVKNIFSFRKLKINVYFAPVLK